jgi:hypothetical protein
MRPGHLQKRFAGHAQPLERGLVSTLMICSMRFIAVEMQSLMPSAPNDYSRKLNVVDDF